MGIGCAVNVLLGPLRTQDFAINPFTVLLGIFVGRVYGFMFEALGKALEKGPPGLTFSILSRSTVFPAVVMSLYFGAAFGFVSNEQDLCKVSKIHLSELHLAQKATRLVLRLVLFWKNLNL